MVWLLFSILILFDAQNVFSRWRGRTLAASKRRSKDFTIVVALYGHPRYFAERRQLAALKDNVVVSLDIGGELMPAFADQLEREGWRVHRTLLAEPGPPALVLDAIESGAVATTYVARMDADTRPLGDVGKFVAAMEDDDTDLASVRVEVARVTGSLAERMQVMEYRMAMLSRRLRPWLTSGACFVARTEVLRAVLRRHSLWFPGEDVETGRVGLALGYRVRHLDLAVETDAPASFPALYRQRRSWWAGGFRHAIVNLDKNFVHMPLWTVYYSGIVCFGAIAKVHGNLPARPLNMLFAFAVLFAAYAALTMIANNEVFTPLMLLYPPYAFLQAIAMPLLGALFFVKYAIKQKRLGRYAFPYSRGVPPTRAPAMPGMRMRLRAGFAEGDFLGPPQVIEHVSLAVVDPEPDVELRMFPRISLTDILRAPAPSPLYAAA